MAAPPTGASTKDTEQLHQLGYAQELRRGMKTFSNFAVSFTIISILSGCSLFFFAFSGLWMYVQMWRGRLSLSQTGKKLRGGRFFWG